MAANKPVIHAPDHRPAGALGVDDPGGADPIVFPAGLIAGTSGFDTAYEAPQSLLALWRMGDTFSFPASPTTDVSAVLNDTSHFDATNRALNYHEENTAGGWTAANRPTLAVAQHSELGAADDGSVLWTASGATQGLSFPGAAFYRSMSDLGTASKSMLFWFNPYLSAPSVAGEDSMLCGSWAGLGGGSLASGGGVFYKWFTNQFRFQVSSGSSVVLSITGPTNMVRNASHLIGVTHDGSTLRLFINAVEVATFSTAVNYADMAGTTFRVGGTTNAANPGWGYFAVGGIDDVSLWSTALTAAEQAAIHAAVGSSTGVTTGAIHAGNPGSDPFAVSSDTATAGQGLLADGSGNTVFADVYHPTGTDVAVTDGGTGASTASAARTNLGVAIGTDVQAHDADLDALGGVTSAADKLPYFTGASAASVTTLTAFIRTLLDDADAATARATLGVVGALPTDTKAWMPLTTVVSGSPELVWDADNNLIPDYVTL